MGNQNCCNYRDPTDFTSSVNIQPCKNILVLIKLANYPRQQRHKKQNNSVQLDGHGLDNIGEMQKESEESQNGKEYDPLQIQMESHDYVSTVRIPKAQRSLKKHQIPQNSDIKQKMDQNPGQFLAFRSQKTTPLNESHIDQEEQAVSDSGLNDNHIIYNKQFDPYNGNNTTQFYHSTVMNEDNMDKTNSNTMAPKGSSQNEHAEHFIEYNGSKINPAKFNLGISSISKLDKNKNLDMPLQLNCNKSKDEEDQYLYGSRLELNLADFSKNELLESEIDRQQHQTEIVINKGAIRNITQAFSQYQTQDEQKQQRTFQKQNMEGSDASYHQNRRLLVLKNWIKKDEDVEVQGENEKELRVNNQDFRQQFIFGNRNFSVVHHQMTTDFGNDLKNQYSQRNHQLAKVYLNPQVYQTVRHQLKSFRVTNTNQDDQETVLMRNEGHLYHNEPMIEIDLASVGEAELLLQILESHQVQGQGASQNEIFIIPPPKMANTTSRGRNLTSAPKIDYEMTNFKREKKIHPSLVLLSPSSQDNNKQIFRSMHADKIKMLFQHENDDEGAEGHIHLVNDSNADFI